MSVWPLPRILFQDLMSVQEKRPVALLTTHDTWMALNSRLALPVLIQAEPPRHSAELFDYLAQNLPSQIKVLYAVGSGAPVEAAKVIAARNNLPLVIVPTALDSALPYMPAALVDERIGEGDDERFRRVLVETGPATEVIIDWDLIEAAPVEQRGAGIVDVLSCVTALLDWRHAAQHGKNPREQRFQPWAASIATDLTKEAIKNSGPIGQGQSDALRTLLNLMMMSVQLSSQLEHTRAQHGGEHFLAQILGAVSQSTQPHAGLVAPCLLFCAALHGQDPSPLRDAMQQAGIPLDQVRTTDFNLTIDQLGTHLADYEFPFSILSEFDPQTENVLEAIEAAGMTLLPDTWMTLEETQPVEPVALESSDEAAADVVDEAVDEVADDVADDVAEADQAEPQESEVEDTAETPVEEPAPPADDPDSITPG